MNINTTHGGNGTGNLPGNSGSGTAGTARWRAALGCLLLGLALPVFAGLPEPGVRIYGTVAVDGVLLTAADTGYSVEVRRSPDGPALASYRMGAQSTAGNFYSLRLDAETATPLAGSATVPLGSTVYVVVRDAAGDVDEKSFTLTQRGLALRMDFGSLDTDGDGLSDEFELANFGNATGGDPNADADLDGRPNLREFLQGTDPNVPDGRHPADRAPADDRLTLQEVTDYILAWKTGGTWPVEPALSAPNIEDYITRAGALWKGGEVYVFDNDPTTNAPMWWVNPAIAPGPSRSGPRLAALSSKPESNLSVSRALPGSYRPNQPAAVTVTVIPDEATRAYAVVEAPPAGWTVRNLSHEGRWDATNRKIKWGPFFDQTPRTFTYEAVPGPNSTGSAEFTGRGSFDGFGLAAAGPLRVWPPGQTPAPQLAAAAGGNEVLVELHGEPGRSYQVEFSEDFGSWNAGQSVTLDAQGRASVPAGDAPGTRFFRLRSLE